MNGNFSFNGGSINYNICGDGETIVFLHGFSLDSRMWDEQVGYFCNRYQCLTFDMRGYGKSSLPSKEYSYYEDLKSLLDHLNIKSAHIVGLSLGGEEALNFVLDYPDYAKSLTLVSSSLGGFSSTVDWDVHINEVGLEAAKVNWINHPVFASTHKYPSVLSSLKKMVADYSGWHWQNSGFRIRPIQPAIGRLTKISCPVLVVTGELDLNYYHDIASILEKSIKSVKKVVIKNSGHMLTMEQPDLFNSILDKFISI